MVKLQTDACQFSSQCGFYHKFSHKESPAWRGLFDTYCRGALVDHCERYKLYLAESNGLRDEVMPNGQSIPTGFDMLL